MELNIFPSMSLMNLMLLMEATRMGGVVKKKRNTNRTVCTSKAGTGTCTCTYMEVYHIAHTVYMGILNCVPQNLVSKHISYSRKYWQELNLVVW